MTKDMRDPVCGMRVNPEQSLFNHEHAGYVYHFCCDGCLTAFKRTPDEFLTSPAESGDCGVAGVAEPEHCRRVHSIKRLTL